MASAVLLTLGAGAAPAQAPELTARQQQDLAQQIGGRVEAGHIECVRRSPLLKLHVVSDDLIVYRVGAKRYVSRTIGRCNGLMRGGKPVISGNNSARICMGDTVYVEDFDSGLRLGMCGIGRFAIYDHPAR